MLLGKRPRPPIRRTTSMTGITIDPSNVDVPDSSDPYSSQNHQMMGDLHATMGPQQGSSNFPNNMTTYSGNNINEAYDHRFLSTMASPRNHGLRNSGDFVEIPQFLRTCGLCKRRLTPGKDIYMYRGDAAFCSLECREEQIKEDERYNITTSPSTRSAKASGKSETLQAAA